MKHTLRVAAAEPYSYLEFEFIGDAEEAIEEYNRLTKIVKGEIGEGLDTKAWNAFIDEFLKTGTVVNGGNVYEHMNAEQKKVISEIKKSNNRTK